MEKGNSWANEFSVTFAKGQSWSTEDEKLHRLIIQGPASIEDLNDAYKNEKSSDDTDDEEVSQDTDDSSLLPGAGAHGDGDDGNSELAFKITSRSYSPELKRNARPMKANDSFDSKLEDAIERAILLS